MVDSAKQFWPGGARLAVSFSLMFEASGQPISGAGGVIPDPIEKGLPDLPTNAFFQYGIYEGIPRVLDLFDIDVGAVTRWGETAGRPPRRGTVDHHEPTPAKRRETP